MSTATLNIEKKKVLVPHLRFKEFSETSLYKKHFFKDIFQFTTGKNIKQNEASPFFETPCVRYGELYHMYNEVIYEIINKTNLDKSQLLFSKGDEILLPSAGEDPLDIGSASALTIENIAIGRTINILRPIEENIYSQIYVSYYINYKLKRKISKLAKGSSISNVYNSDLKTLEIILPDFSEQQKIASFLSTVDEKIQQLSRKKDLLEQYKKGVMQQLFSGKLRFKDENGKDYADWEEKKLGDIGKFYAGGDLDKLNYNKIKSNEFIYPIYANGSGEGIYGYATTFQYKKNSVTVSGRGNLGYANVRTQNFNAIVRLIVIEPKDFINPKYLVEIINQTKFAIESTGVPQLTVPQIKSYKIIIPSYQEQQKIADFLSSIDAKIESSNQQINQTQSFKKGLLQRMFV